MRRTEQRQGVRMLKLRDVLTRWEAGSLSPLEAAEIVGMSERSVRRWTRRFEEVGEHGLLDRRLGRRSGRAVPEDEADEVGPPRQPLSRRADLCGRPGRGSASPNPPTNSNKQSGQPMCYINRTSSRARYNGRRGRGS